MTDPERIARAERAQSALDEFITPLLDEVEETYLKRLRDVSTTDYNSRSRSDKQTALSTALVVLQSVRSGLNEVVLDGRLARDSQLKAEKIEKMTAPERRLLNMLPR